MAEFILYKEDPVGVYTEATDEEYLRGYSKVLKADWLSGVFTVADFPLLRAIYSAADADGTFSVFAADVNPQPGEIAMRFKYNEAGLASDDVEKLKLLMELARRAGQARVINETIGKVYITVPGATAFATAAETALARG